MARKRINPDCATYRIQLCDEALEEVLKVKASIRRQCSMSDAINKLIKEYSFFKDHKNTI